MHLAGIMRFQKIALTDCSFPALARITLGHNRDLKPKPLKPMDRFSLMKICNRLELISEFKRRSGGLGSAGLVTGFSDLRGLF